MGAYFEANCRWSFGCSYKSPQWFEKFEWNALDENGLPQVINLDLTVRQEAYEAEELSDWQG